MADSDVLVTVSGAAFSLLLYENVRSSGDQMGFLLGDVLVFISKKVTDSDRQIEHEKKHINIDTIITCPKFELFYDNKGCIDIEKLNNYVGENKKKIIGWFRYRRFRYLIPTLREKILHKEFADYFGTCHGYSKENFVTCLLNKSENPNRATHMFHHVFLRQKNRIMEALPARINNLGGDATRLEGTDYKSIPENRRVRESDAFTELLQKMPEIDESSGVVTIKKIQEKVEARLSKLIPELCKSEEQVALLEQEILELRDKLWKNGEDTKTGCSMHLNNDSPIDIFLDSDNEKSQKVSPLNKSSSFAKDRQSFSNSLERSATKEKKKSPMKDDSDQSFHLKNSTPRARDRNHRGEPAKVFISSTSPSIGMTVSEQMGSGYATRSGRGSSQKHA